MCESASVGGSAFSYIKLMMAKELRDRIHANPKAPTSDAIVATGIVDFWEQIWNNDILAEQKGTPCQFPLASTRDELRWWASERETIMEIEHRNIKSSGA